MNNEEKILAMLEQLQQGQAQTNVRLDGLEAGQKAMQSDIKVIKKKVEFTADVLEGTIKMVDDLEQKYRVI